MVAMKLIARRLAGALLGIVLLGPVAHEAVAAQVDPFPFPHDNSRLRVRIEERWKVIPLHGGVLLVPRRPSSLLKGVEICQDGIIAIDGATVTGADLQNRLGADADAVLQLSYLSADERVDLFKAPGEPEPVERKSTAVAAKGSGRTPGGAAGAGVGAGSGAWTEVMPIVRGDRFRFGGDATVDESEQVTSVTTILGSANIDGVVLHDVVVIGGDVRLGPKAMVRGAVTTIGGAVKADPNARIAGAVSELGMDSANLRVWWPENGINNSFNIGIKPDWPRIARIAFYGGLLKSAVWIALCAGVLVLAPASVERTREKIANRPFGAFAAGFATQVLFAPLLSAVVAVLAMSVIGIPLIALAPLAMFMVFLATLVGSAAMFVAFGERLIGRLTSFGALFVGGAALCSVTLVGRYLWMHGQGTLGWGFALACVGLGIEYFVVTIGLGGAVLSWTRRLSWRRKHAIASEPLDTPIMPVSAPLDL
jgi:hypothetical protein